MSFSDVLAQTFNKSTDLLLANYDLMPDMDDVHSIAAMGCMLKHEDYQDVNYWAVCGAYGKQEGYDYIHTVAPEFMTLCFGPQNVKWTDAHNDWSGSVTRVTADVVEILNAGGNVFVQEGGQSDFSYDVAQAAIAAGVSADKIKNNFIIVQHSNWNTNQSSEKNWLNSGDVNYIKIEDCNTADNGTPCYKETSTEYITAAISEDNPNGYAQAFWSMANDICTDWNAGNPTIAAGGIDFSDHGENWYIFGWNDKYMTVQEFFDEFVTNDIGPVDFPPTVKFIAPTQTNFTIPEGSLGIDIVPVEISATDDGDISYVELYLDDELISKKTNTSYIWTNDAVLKNMGIGTYTLKAIAEDNANQKTEATLTIVLEAARDQGNGVEYGDHWVVCEMENTTSPLGLWELRTPEDANYFPGAINDTYLEFTGNTVAGSGQDRSPLTYTFTAPKTAQYELLMRFHQNLDNGNGGTYAGDYCNDVYITMEGNFTSGHAKLSEEELRTEQKFFGKGRDWGVGYRITMYTDGEKNYPARYNLIEGEEYIFTIAGRSKQCCVDYWLFIDNSEVETMPTAQMDMATELDAKYLPGLPGNVEVVDVTGVTVSPETAEIKYIGATTKLTAAVAPYNATIKTVSWSSSNEDVATVSSTGLVTAISKGTATITATTTDGGFSDMCIITSLDEPLPETQITGEYHICNRNGLSLYAGDESRTAGDTLTLVDLIEGDANMIWVENLRADGYYFYQLKNTNYCIDGGDGGAKNQAIVISTFDSENQNQHWTKEYISDGVYRLIKRDVEFGINSTGTTVNLWKSSTTSANLHWTFIDAIGEATNINKASSQGINVYSNPTSNSLIITTDKEISKVEIFAIDGRLVSSQFVSGTTLKFTLPEVGQPLLLVNVVLKDGGKITKKIFVE